MMSLIKCHLSYLLNKRAVVILTAAVVIAFFVCAINAAAVDAALGYRENNAIYFRTSFTTVKTMTVFSSIFLVCDFFSAKNSQYYYLISCDVSRVKYFTTKLHTVVLLQAGFVLLLYLLFNFAGFAFYAKYVFDARVVFSFFCLFIYAVYYGLAALAFYQALKNNYVIIFVFFLHLFSVITNEENEGLGRILNCFLLYLDTEGNFPYHPYHALLLIVLLFSFNLLFFLDKDL